MSSGAHPGAPARPWAAIGLLALASVALLAGLGKEPPRVEAEQRCAEIVHRMCEHGDWLLPRLGRWVWPQKPPLFYWCSAAACEAAGGFGLFAFRLPSAIAAIGVLLVVLAWGRELRAPVEAALAAVLLAATYEFLVQGRRGAFEMLLAFFSNAALLAAYRATLRPTAGRVALASALFGLAFLDKATPALVYMAAPLAAWAVACRRARALLDRRAWIALLAGMAACVAWYAYVWIVAPGVRWRIEGQLLLPLGLEPTPAGGAHHHQPFWFFFESLGRKGFLLSLFVPLASVHLWRTRREEAWSSPWRLLLLAFAVPFVVLSCLPMKQDHYLLPVLPPLALLVGRAIVWGGAQAAGVGRWLLRLPALLALVVAAIAGGVASWALCARGPWPAVPAACAGAGIAASCVASAIAFGRARPRLAVAAGALALTAVWTVWFTQAPTLTDAFRR